MKRCSTCREVKPLDQFNLRSTSPDGHQWNCRACNAAYHRDNWPRHMSQIRARRRRIGQENRRLMLEYLDAHPCVDCGERDLVVLEFDHLRDKRANVSRMLRNYEWATVLREMAKCEVVCANCHRRRTHTRQGSYRIFGVSDDDDGQLPML